MNNVQQDVVVESLKFNGALLALLFCVSWTCGVILLGCFCLDLEGRQINLYVHTRIDVYISFAFLGHAHTHTQIPRWPLFGDQQQRSRRYNAAMQWQKRISGSGSRLTVTARMYIYIYVYTYVYMYLYIQ